MDIRFKMNGNHQRIYITLMQELDDLADKEVYFRKRENEIYCFLQDTPLGKVGRFEDKSFLEFLLETKEFYRAFVEESLRHRAAVSVYQPMEHIKDIKNFTVHTGKIGNEASLADRYVLNQKYLFLALDEKEQKYLLFGSEYRIGVLTWENDQLAFVREKSYTTPKEYETLIKSAFLFETKVTFSQTPDVTESQVEMAILPKLFQRSYHYLQQWSEYMEFEKQFIEHQITSCKPLSYKKLEYRSQAIRFHIENADDIDNWMHAQTSLMVSAEIPQKNGSREIILGRLLQVKDGYVDVEYDEDDTVSPLELRNKGTIRVSNQANEVAVSRRRNAMKKVLERKSVLKQLREILSEKGVVPDIQVYRYGFPSASVPTLINGLPPDSKQQRAVEMALNTENICLIQGPPGTGKTSVIQTIIKCLVAQGKDKILLTSFQHLAVDNAMEGLMGAGLLTHRYGSEAHDLRNESEYRALVNNLVDDVKRQLPDEVNQEGAQNALLICDELKRMIDANRMTEADVEHLENVLDSLGDFALDHMDVFIQMSEVLMSLSLIKNRAMLPVSREKLDKVDQLLAEVPVSLEGIQNRESFQKWKELIQAFEQLADEARSNYQLVTHLVSQYQHIEKNRRRVLLLDEDAQQVSEFRAELQALYENSVHLAKEFSTTHIENAEEYLLPFAQIRGQLLDLMEAIRRAAASEESTRLSSIQTIQREWLKQISADPLALGEVVKKYANVKGVTCQQAGAKRHQLFDVVYDVVIVDEAARANPLDLLIPLTMGRKVILVGDHKQLPHMLEHQFEITNRGRMESQETFEEVYKKSLFERLYAYLPPSKKVMLSKQFRMHPIIGELVSRLFYPESLQHGMSAEALKNDTGMYDGKNVAWLDVPYMPNQGRQETGRYQNVAEAELILKELKKLVQNNAHYEIGVITFYSEQAGLLDRMVKNQGLEEFVEVGTVDAFQGKEKDIVFLSTVRSNPFPSLRQSLGFLQFPNRLNVAISRGKRLLVVVGDSSTLGKDEYFHNVYMYIKENGYVTIH